MTQPIAVVAEARSGTLKRPSLEAVSAARTLARAAGGEVVAVLAGHGLANAAAALAEGGADKVIALDAQALARYSGDGYGAVLTDRLQALDPAAVLMPHSAMGKDVMPRIAAALDTGLATDVIALHFENGIFGATRPVYAGKATLRVNAARAPFMATLRPNNFQVDEGATGGTVATVTPQVPDFGAVVVEVIAASADRTPLQEAKVIVSGGRGLQEPESFKLVEDLAAAFGPGVASVGASRAVVDSGWRPHREQVGQTGKVVAPTLYIACGISGAIQHLAGMKTSRTIVAINKDAEAPIFKVADYGIVGDVFEVLPALTAAIKAAVAD